MIDQTAINRLVKNLFPGGENFNWSGAFGEDPSSLDPEQLFVSTGHTLDLQDAATIMALLAGEGIGDAW